MRNWKGIGSSIRSSSSEEEASSEYECESASDGSFPGGSGRMPIKQNAATLRVFVATWNVGGKSPQKGLDLNGLLRTNDPSDVYVLGFQEIVPLNAGNVLVIEDTEPAVKWLALINQSLNKPVSLPRGSWSNHAPLSSSLFFPKPSLKRVSKIFRTETGRKLKSCNCSPEFLERKNSKDHCFRCQQRNISEDDLSSEEDDDGLSGYEISELANAGAANTRRYSLIASKQMVGIFVTVWMKTELVQHVAHLRISSVSRGIMGCLGNKGCISVRMSFHRTSLCFICSHLASGEREGDELRRNSDVIEILKNTQFQKICGVPNSRMPSRILDHDRVFWFGDLNYRISLSYSETRKLMDRNDLDALLDKDQLKIEREAGRVFTGWKEGKIYFAPTYKYTFNSDSYIGEDAKSKNKRRTPAWCDRILWRGEGVRQLWYIRGESTFSDHRPVCAEFTVDVVVAENGSNKKFSTLGRHNNMKVGDEELLPRIGRGT
ncbi:hypothetical protein MLD38_003787 [Melastoma candidum]|uniref:Uncharacterized protein n=1 Tax=Melastoma candidum TaxID=119954 RepID=A0ACB9S574_9MYRT|nr:hypothetical protein MLD38_003787 [Melastoma candidum]